MIDRFILKSIYFLSSKTYYHGAYLCTLYVLYRCVCSSNATYVKFESLLLLLLLSYSRLYCFFSLQMITGGLFLKGILDMAHYVASPVHFYVYDYLNDYSMNAAYGPYPGNLGVSHGDELISLFNTSKPLADYDQKVSRLMVNIWTNFASTEYESFSHLSSYLSHARGVSYSYNFSLHAKPHLLLLYMPYIFSNNLHRRVRTMYLSTIDGTAL